MTVKTGKSRISLNDNQSFNGSSFDGERAYAHVQELCHPRRVGSAGERRAARYIAREFAGIGLQLIREPFGVSHFAVEAGSRLVFTVCAALTFGGALLAGGHPFWAALCWAAAGILVNSPWRVAHYLGCCWPARATSENLVATMDEPANDAPARVIFMAHYDTKSQYVPTGVRVGLVSAVTLLCGALAVFGLIAAAGFPPILRIAGPSGLSMIVIVLLAGLIANFSGNRSPGALDNGSGVGTLLELARSWRPHDDMPIETVWVATGSEELGLNGARNFVDRHEHWWQEKPTLLINLESVGAGPCIYLAGQHQALRLAEEVADELGLARAELHVLGAGMDHEPFAARDLESVSILGDVVRKSFHMHSARDNMNLIERSALERAGMFAAQLAACWAELHQPAEPVRQSNADLALENGVPLDDQEAVGRAAKYVR